MRTRSGFPRIAFGLNRPIGFLGDESSHPTSIANSEAESIERPISQVSFLPTLPRISLVAREFCYLPFDRFAHLPINQCVGLPPKIPCYRSGNVAQYALPIYQSINRLDNEGRNPPARHRRTVASAYCPSSLPID